MTEGPRQTPAFRSYDGTFRYIGPTGHEGRCYLQVFERRGALPVVLVWETKDNPGASVTNAAAQVATQAWRRLLPQAKEGIIFVEGYIGVRQRKLRRTAILHNVAFRRCISGPVVLEVRFLPGSVSALSR